MAARVALPIALGALMTVSILELSFIVGMVGWLLDTASGTFVIRYNGSTFDLSGEPKDIMVNQGHTSNGAAGTAFVLVGLGGILALWLRSRDNFHKSRFSVVFYHSWLVVNVLALLLTFASLVYVFVVTNAHKGQTIDVALASTLDGRKYPTDTWTPQNWFSALLKLDIADADVRKDISDHLRLMRGWQYNLIPFFLVQLVETALAVWDAFMVRKAERSTYTDIKKDAEAQ